MKGKKVDQQHGAYSIDTNSHCAIMENMTFRVQHKKGGGGYYGS